jgi:hypothetical protein
MQIIKMVLNLSKQNKAYIKNQPNLLFLHKDNNYYHKLLDYS